MDPDVVAVPTPVIAATSHVPAAEPSAAVEEVVMVPASSADASSPVQSPRPFAEKRLSNLSQRMKRMFF